MIAEVRDRTQVRKHPKWYSVVQVNDGQTTWEKEIARFAAHGDAYMWALEVSKRPDMVSTYAVRVTLEIRDK
jgi:hypothetical protein